jgi:ArsR family transcriptional regulator
LDTQEYSDPIASIGQHAAKASIYLKSLAHEGRLKILCHLIDGEKSVRELEHLLNARQAAVSQMLARLRDDGLVTTRRSGKTVYYSLADETVQSIISVLYERFCLGAKRQETEAPAY